MMSIPEDWLYGPTELADVEEGLAENGAPDSWLRQWRRLLGRLEPGDELWEYSGEERPPCVVELEDEIPGFELVHDRQILDWIDEVVPANRISRFRSGFGLIREGAILDWIEAPP
jgi:hypothetical protein